MTGVIRAGSGRIPSAVEQEGSDRMQVDRRKLLVLTAMTAVGWNGKARAADDEHALFWRAKVGNGSAILYGYERIAASRVPDIVKDGDRFIDETTRVVQDLSPVVKFPPIQIARKEVVPLSKTLSEPVMSELRAVFAETPQIGEMTNLLSGFETTSLLMGEGQAPSTPSAGGMIADHARTLKRPTVQLIADAEAQALWNPPDLAALNKSIDESKIKYLLDLRRQVGPIGAHLEQLYLDRKGEEINRFTAEIRKHGIVSPTSFLSEDRMRALLFDRLVKTLSAQDAVAAFALLPLGLLTGGDGVLAKLRAGGNAVTALA